MTPAPLAYRWSGDSFEVMPRFAKEADKRFTVGECYLLEHIEERSAKSHRHFFASVSQAWVNLPEAMADRFATADHLRKWCLVRAGYHDHRSIVCASKAEARRVAAFVKPMDEMAVVSVSEAVVNVWTAKSQSVKAMGKKDFQTSKDAVLAILADMIGTAPAELEKAGERS